MALMRVQGEIPANAIRLERSEAVEYQRNVIDSWPYKSQTWPFRWGVQCLAAIAGASGMYINNVYRGKLRLGHYGFVTTSFPMVVGPAIFASGFHMMLVTNSLLIGETKCTLCAQNTAAMAQIGCSVLYPIVLSPLGNFLYALRHDTYKLPQWSDAKGTLQLWWRFTKPMGQSLLIVACLNAIAAGVLTYYEASKIDEIQAILRKQGELAQKQKAQKMAKAKLAESSSEIK